MADSDPDRRIGTGEQSCHAGMIETKSIVRKSLRLSSRQPSNVYDVHSSKMFQMTSAFGEYVEHTSIPTLVI